jgi:hypothetical protein
MQLALTGGGAEGAWKHLHRHIFQPLGKTWRLLTHFGAPVFRSRSGTFACGNRHENPRFAPSFSNVPHHRLNRERSAKHGLSRAAV